MTQRIFHAEEKKVTSHGILKPCSSQVLSEVAHAGIQTMA